MRPLNANLNRPIIVPAAESKGATPKIKRDQWRYTDSKAAQFHQRESFGPFSKEFFALAKLTRWVIYGAPLDEFKKPNANFHPIYMTPFDGFVR